MPTDGERLAVLETRFVDLRGDVDSIAEEERRTRKRLHDLEGFAQAYLDVQKANRRAEDRQYRRVTNTVAVGGFLMSAALVALTVATILLHN